MKSTRLLLVEDDAGFALALRAWMGPLGVDLQWIANCGETVRTLQGQNFDCVIFDLGLSCALVARAVIAMRELGLVLPILVLSSPDQVQDRIRLLDMGVDDFLLKPLHLDELAARLKALLRRRRQQELSPGELRHGNLRVVAASRTVLRNNAYVPLTDTEFWILETLLRSKGKTLSRDQIEARLGDRISDAGSNALEVHVHHLRRKLGSEVIKTVRGIGYTLGQEA